MNMNNKKIGAYNYTVYQKPYMKFSGIAFLIAAILIIIMSYKRYMMVGFNAQVIFGFIVIIALGIMYAVFVRMLNVDPFVDIKKLKADDPELSAAMLKEFNIATEICKNVKKSESFYYFLGEHKVLAVPFGEITDLKFIEGYKIENHMSYAIINVKSPYGDIEKVYVAVNKSDIESAANAIGIVCKENNIVFNRK